MFLLCLLGEAVNEDLPTILSMPGVHHTMVYDDDDSFKALFIQTDSQRSLFQQYGDVLQLDCVHKVFTVLIN